MRRLLQAAFFLPASLLLLGCRDARTSDVTGFWRLENFSRAYLPAKFGSLTPTLHVVTDHTFTATDYPLYGDPVEPLTFSGTWTVERRNGLSLLVLRTENVTPNGGGFQTDLNIDHGLISGHHLRVFVDDPDEGKAVEFERIQ